MKLLFVDPEHRHECSICLDFGSAFHYRRHMPPDSDSSRPVASADASYVAVIGGASIDIHGISTGPLRGNDSNPGTVHTSAGGVARNVAENLARLGVECRLVSAVGDDYYGQMLVRLSQDAGVDIRHVREIAGARTSTYLSVIDDIGDMLVAVADMDIIDHVNAAQLKPIQAMMQQSSIIVIDTNLPDDALAWIAESFSGKPIFADTVSTSKAPRLKPYLAAIHTLKTGTAEVEALTGLDAGTPEQLREAARELHVQGVKHVFVTRGDQGIFYSGDAIQDVRKPARGKPEVLNAGGAGDAFLAGLTYARLKDFDLTNTIQFALAASEVTLSHPAASSPALSLATIHQAMEASDDV